MAKRKNQAAVDLGRRGGKVKSAAKSATAKARGSAWGPRTIAAYREGWAAGMQRAAGMVRALKDGAPTEVTDQGLDWLADRIAAEPAPRK